MSTSSSFELHHTKGATMKIGMKSALVATASIVALTGTMTFPAAAGASGTTTLQLANDKSPWTSAYNAIGPVIAKADGGIGWQAQPYPSTTAFQAVVRASATTSKSPPLYTWWSGQQLLPLVKAGAVADLTPYVKTWEAKYGLNPDVENAYKVNGKYYGAPENTADWVMFYNKKDFAKYNLGVPTTWAQLMSDAATFKKNGIAPFLEHVNDWAGFIWFEQMLAEMNPTAYQQLVTGKISYTNPAVVQAMNEWKTLATDGYFATPTNIDDPSSAQAFVNGSDAMMLLGSWDEATLIKSGMKPGKDFGTFVVPPINPKVGWQMIFETGPIVVSAHSSQQQAALTALNAFMTPAVQAKWDQLQSFTSPESAVKTTDPTAIAVANQIKTEHVTLVNRYWEATPPQIAVPVSSDLSKFILNPNLSLMPFLQTLQQVATSYWSTVKG
jgi:ABC-type glycerol-3-phosphate transport system substrate-binding protein